MKNLFALFIGISIIIGLSAGYITTETKYSFLPPGASKREITLKTYNSFIKDSNYSDFVESAKVFNAKNAIIFSLGALGMLLISSYFIPKK